jgi:hypothetical protein
LRPPSSFPQTHTHVHTQADTLSRSRHTAMLKGNFFPLNPVPNRKVLQTLLPLGHRASTASSPLSFTTEFNL